MRQGAARRGRIFLPPLFAFVALAATLLLAHSPGEAQALTGPRLHQHAAGVALAGSGNLTVVVGCVASPLPTDITFAAQPTANGALARPVQQVAPTSAAAIPVGTSGVVVVNGFDLTHPQNPLECGAVVQDNPPDIDANPNTVDTGTLTYSLQTLGGRFAILNNGSSVYSMACAQTTGSVSGFEGCLGGEYTAGAAVVTPNPALVIRVGLAPGVALSSLGSLSGVTGLSGLSLTATYTRDPSLSANPAAVPPGPETALSAVSLGIFGPTYVLALSASPATIPARPQSPMPGAGAPVALAGQSSTITANLSTVAVAIAGAVVVGTPTGTTAVGVEPGTVSFSTNLGVFGDLSSQFAAGQQTEAVACGQLPGFNPVYNPATFTFATYSLTSCQTAKATLYGSGQAGQATVVATFVGSITGTQAQSATTVVFSTVPSQVGLMRGCNQVNTPAGLAPSTPAITYVDNNVTPSAAVAGMWQYNNLTQSFQALYFTTGQAPTIANPVVGPHESVFLCLSTPAAVTVT